MAEHMVFEKKVDTLGRVVLPKTIRDLFDIKAGDYMRLSLTEDGKGIMLRKASKRCLKCGSPENLKEITPNHYLCGECLSRT